MAATAATGLGAGMVAVVGGGAGVGGVLGGLSSSEVAV